MPQFGILFFQLGYIRQEISIALDAQESHGVSGALELGADDLVGLGGADRECHQGGGHIQLVEAAGHGVLAAYGRRAELELGAQRAQQCRQGLAPALRLAAQAFKVFLEAHPGLADIAAGGGDAGIGLDHGIQRAVVGTPGAEIGVIAMTHNRAGIAAALLQGQLSHHGLVGSEAFFAAQCMYDCASAGAGVKALDQPFLRAYIQ